MWLLSIALIEGNVPKIMHSLCMKKKNVYWYTVPSTLDAVFNVKYKAAELDNELSYLTTISMQIFN
jgi:hypothetical protein